MAVALAAKPTIAATAGAEPIKLSMNENPFGPSQRAIEAIRDHLGGLFRYVGDEARALTQTIADLEGVAPEQVVLGEILNALGLVLAVGGGDRHEFIYTEPGYTALVDAVAPAGGTVTGIPLDKDLRNDLPAIARAITNRTRAVYLVNPHNPTGTVSDAQPFLDFVRDISRKVPVIVDEAYLEFLPDFTARTTARLTRENEQVIVFRTFAKIFGLAGLGMGYALLPRDLAVSLIRSGFGAAPTLNRLGVVAASASLTDKDYVATVRGKVAEERERWHQFLGGLKRRFAEARGNFIFFETGKPHAQVAKAFADRGILIGKGYPAYDDWARITIGLPAENEAARAAVRQILG
jgi:histidinol-phosphate aminotransferase